MFEFDKLSSKNLGVRTAVSLTPVFPIKPEKAALLLWGEHCVECAAPQCYSTCDLYEPRPDGRCRRFEDGAVPSQQLSGSRGPAADIVFRKWGKLEARGNSYLFPSDKLNALERLLLRSAPLGNSVGRGLARLFGDERWNYLTFSALERLNKRLLGKSDGDRPDGFLFEATNPTTGTVVLVLSMSVDRTKLNPSFNSSPDSIPRPFVRRITLDKGHYRELIPYTSFRDILESGLPFNIAIVPEGEEGARVIFQNLDFVKLGKPDRENLSASLERPEATPKQEVKRASAAKCVVFDLDNTLWDGVLLENENVQLQKEVSKLLSILDQRGILLSIASKNTKEHALSRLKALGVEEYFLFPKVNWGPKSDSVKQIAADLNIGLDTFIFVDDNPFELSEVSQALPAVECLPVEALAELAVHPRLRGSDSAEARTRRKMYQQEMARAEVEQSLSGDYTEFLRSCEIQVLVRTNRAEDTERISELVQRTNQLNFSGRKYTRDEVGGMLAARDIERFVIECKDKFGSYGIVGFCVVRRKGSTALIEDFMLSCRVQGKLIESVLFDCICNRSGKTTTRLEVNFKKTDRNVPAQQVLKNLEFALSSYGVGRDVLPGSFAVDFIAARFDTIDGS